MNSEKTVFQQQLKASKRSIRYVTFLKRFIIVLILAFIAFFLFFLFFKPTAKEDLPIMVFKGNNVTLLNAKIENFSQDQLKYKLTAENIDQQKNHFDKEMVLKNVHGKLFLAPHDQLNFYTLMGFYRPKDGVLYFNKPLIMKGKKGEKIFIREGSLDFKTKKMISKKELYVEKGNASIKAGGGEAVLGGKIMFYNSVHVIMPPF